MQGAPDKAGKLVLCSIMAGEDIPLSARSSLTASCMTGTPEILPNKESYTRFPQLADPVVKDPRIDALFLAPLIIGEYALAAFHNQLDLFMFSYTARIHNDRSLKIE